MRTTSDAAGRLVVPKPLRDQLGMTPGTQLDLEVVDGRLAAEAADRLTAKQVREVMERGRR
ncbi:MAG TPA: AbrB/MazE/SpoVT family DNA-binding domain-containing protein [Solirubrobacteraceae bacterium]|jgi:AbrB family looped-hinge helix DNA binding protein